MAEVINLEARVELAIYSTNEYVPLTGVFATEEDIKGWRWDTSLTRKRLHDYTSYGTYLGGHTSNLLDGTYRTDWQSGTIDDCKYIKSKKVDSLTVPIVKTGEFSILWESRKLYSNYSVSDIINYTDETPYVYVLPTENAQSISAAIWERKNDYMIMKAMEFEHVDTFTGMYVEGQRVETVDEYGDPMLDMVSPFHKEFIVHEGEVIFNAAHSIKVGNDILDTPVIKESWERLGAGKEEGKFFYTRYFPIDDDNISVVSIDALDNITMWNIKENLNTSGSGDMDVAVYRDAGIIQLGGAVSQTVSLRQNISNTDTTIYVSLGRDISDYPPFGIIVIDSEEIYYDYRTDEAFCECTRGYNSTVAASHTEWTNISSLQRGMQSTDEFYISYRAVPKIEYEITECSVRDGNDSSFLNIDPLKNIDGGNSIVQITSEEVDLEEIILSTDASIIGGNLYGPLYFGINGMRMTAKALDAKGNPVYDLPVTIEVLTKGKINGTSYYEGTTNHRGEIYGMYNAPYNRGDIETAVTAVTDNGTDTILGLAAPLTNVSPDDIWLFQILKHDPFVGTLGTRVLGMDSDVTTFPDAGGYVKVFGRFGEEVIGGVLYTVDLSLVKVSYEIVGVEYVSNSGEMYTYIYTKDLVPSIDVANRDVWIVLKDSIVWDPNLLNGARVIVYNWDASAIHPVTESSGAYSPLHPTSVSGSLLTYAGSLLPVPDSENYYSPLGAYVVLSDAEGEIQAYATDPISGEEIRSNKIRVKLKVPANLIGVGSSEALPLPHGFKFIVSDYNVGGGLGGANFITINPASTGVHQFTISGVI